MKKIILALIFFPVLAFSQEINPIFLTNPPDSIFLKQDSLFLNGRLIGRIKSIEREGTKIITSISGLEEEVKTTIFDYQVYINEFLSEGERNKIKTYFSTIYIFSGKIFEYEIIETFEGKSNHQISGYYLHKAGELKNKRNNWRIAGSLLAIAIIKVFPPSKSTILAACGVGVFTGIVSLTKDYQANKIMKKSGQYLMK